MTNPINREQDRVSGNTTKDVPGIFSPEMQPVLKVGLAIPPKTLQLQLPQLTPKPWKNNTTETKSNT